MSKKIVLNFKSAVSEKNVYAPVGFSWTNLFMGPIVPLYRGDYKNTAIQAVVNSISGGLALLVWPFIYNKMYIKDMIKDGYKCTNSICDIDKAEQILDIEIPV